MKPYDQNGLTIVTFEAMFNGYADALRRFDAAAKTSDPAATFVPLFDALNWAVALDQRIAAHFVPDGQPAGYGWPQRIGNGAEFMPGVRFARNSVHHQWSDALELRGGADLPDTFPVVFWEWVWRSATQLPSPPANRRPRADNERVYREQMQGRPARLCLRALGEAFHLLKDLLEPFTIARSPEGFAPIADVSEEADVLP